MIKVTNLKEIDQIQPLMLKAYIAKKMTAMMQEYQVDNLDDIGCFIVLEPEEFTDFPIGEVEFVEILFLEESMFCMVSELLMKAMERTSICLLRW